MNFWRVREHTLPIVCRVPLIKRSGGLRSISSIWPKNEEEIALAYQVVDALESSYRGGLGYEWQALLAAEPPRTSEEWENLWQKAGRPELPFAQIFRW